MYTIPVFTVQHSMNASCWCSRRIYIYIYRYRPAYSVTNGQNTNTFICVACSMHNNNKPKWNLFRSTNERYSMNKKTHFRMEMKSWARQKMMKKKMCNGRKNATVFMRERKNTSHSYHHWSKSFQENWKEVPSVQMGWGKFTFLSKRHAYIDNSTSCVWKTYWINDDDKEKCVWDMLGNLVHKSTKVHHVSDFEQISKTFFSRFRKFFWYIYMHETCIWAALRRCSLTIFRLQTKWNSICIFFFL